MDHLRSKKKPVRKIVWVAGDSELADEVANLESGLSREEGSLSVMPEGPRREAALQEHNAKKELHAAKHAELEECSIKFVFQSIGRKNYEALLEQHQPTEKQVADQKAADPKTPLEFNPETFPVALVVASIVEPDADKEELGEWLLNGEEWNSAEFMTLFMAALEVNSTRKIFNSGKD